MYNSNSQPPVEFKLKIAIIADVNSKTWLCNAMSGGNKVLLQCSLPLSPGDTVAGLAIEHINDAYLPWGSSVLLISNEPMVLFGRDYDSLAVSLLSDLQGAYIKDGYSAVKCTAANAENWLRVIYTCYELLDSDTVYPLCEKLIIKAMGNQKIYGDGRLKNIFRSALPSESSALALRKLESVPDEFIVAFLDSWYKHRFLRLLACYGIDEISQASPSKNNYNNAKNYQKPLIEENKLLPTHVIPDLLLSNPFRLPFVPTDLVTKIAKRINFGYTQLDVNAHIGSYALHKKLADGYLAALIDIDPNLDSDTLEKYGITSQSPGFAFTRVISTAQKTISKLREIHERSVSYNLDNIPTLSEDQNQAVTSINMAGVVCITGSAGVGKSTIIKETFRLLVSRNVPVAVATPTGKAANRLRTMKDGGIPKEYVSTIHKLLKTAANYQVILIDESSMVDVSLLHRLLKEAVNLKKLVMVGDSSQLPPVGWGTIFHSIVSCQRFYVINLTKSFRFERDSLSRFIAGVRNGLAPSCHNPGPGVVDPTTCYPSVQRYPGNVDDVYRLYSSLVANGITNIAILTPYNNSADQINALIMKNMGVTQYFFPGQRVMCVRAYSKYDVANGEDGEVRSVNDHEVVVNFNGVDIKFSKHYNVYPSASHLKPCYAITINKSQGSEYDAVICVLDRLSQFITKERVYTAISRAKKMLFIVGNPVILDSAIVNNRVPCTVLDDLMLED
jgi:hypothetical protein